MFFLDIVYLSKYLFSFDFFFLGGVRGTKNVQHYWKKIKNRCCFSLPVWCFFSMLYRCQSEMRFFLAMPKWSWKKQEKVKRVEPTLNTLSHFNKRKRRDVDATDGSGEESELPKNVSMEIQGATKMKIIPEAILT